MILNRDTNLFQKPAAKSPEKVQVKWFVVGQICGNSVQKSLSIFVCNPVESSLESGRRSGRRLKAAMMKVCADVGRRMD